MNFVDKLKEEMENQETEEMPDALQQILQDALAEKILGEPKDVHDLIRETGETYAEVALTFHNKLRGKFTNRQITDMVCTLIDGLTPS